MPGLVSALEVVVPRAKLSNLHCIGDLFTRSHLSLREIGVSLLPTTSVVGGDGHIIALTIR